MTGLPKNWATVHLGVVLPIEYGKGLPAKARNAEGSVAVIGSSGPVGVHDEPYTSGAALVVGRKGNVGSIYYSNQPCWPIDTVFLAEGTPSTFLPYFKYLLIFLDLRYLDKSTAIPGLSRDDYNSVEVPIPPDQEQRRIVEVVESYLSRLDDAVASLERAQGNLKRYRASVLKAAVEGRLVPTEAGLAREEGRDYEPASDLLERVLAERHRLWGEAELAKMTAKGKPPKNDKWRAKYRDPEGPEVATLRDLPPGWVWATVDQLCRSLDQGWSPRCKSRSVNSLDEWGVIKTTAIQHMVYEEEANKALPSDKKPRPHLEIEPGDILITRAGPRVRVGVCCLVRAVTSRLMICDKVYRLRVDDTCVSPGYIELVLNSPRILDEIEKIKSGINDSGLNLTQGKFGSLAVPLPPRAEQESIEKAVATSFSVAERVIRETTGSVGRIGRTRQAILKWAFEGRLVDQDPSDEGAHALLERIAEERVEAPGPIKKKSAARRKR